MAEHAVEFLRTNFNFPKELTIFIISLLPVLELRGGLIAAALLGVAPLSAAVICFVGNILPIPFILLFIRQIFKFLKKFKFTERIIVKIEESALKRSSKVQNREAAGLFFFVAIPLPGTGGWTGALLASLLELPILKSFAVITGGVLCADAIMMIITYLVPGFFF